MQLAISDALDAMAHLPFSKLIFGNVMGTLRQ
jgi:hypothetical protein